jgi:hypothetical protein
VDFNFEESLLTGGSFGYMALMSRNLDVCVCVCVCMWLGLIEVSFTCFSPVELLSGSPQQLFLPFLRYRLNRICINQGYKNPVSARFYRQWVVGLT